jgi:polyisoprenoid-binding protein YceI
MKKLIKISFLFAFVAFLGSCANAPEGEKAAVGDATEAAPADANADALTYTVDLGKSLINWTGSKPTGQHNGTIKLSSGSLMVSNGQVTGGEFVIDMNSLANTDMAGSEGQGKLEGHLKTGDFFETETYPTGKFVITNVGTGAAGQTITGNLTLKDVTKSVTFPASIRVTETAVSAVTPPFTINRTLWGVNFKSTTIGEIADKAIHDDIGLVIALVASAQPAQ